MNQKHLIVIAGPTAVGKTSLGIEIARYLNTEIISCDSRQIYRELEIGTAKPTIDELSQVKHHFINSHSIHDTYSAGMYERDALALITSLFQIHDHLIMVGGSGLYIDAVCSGFDQIPQIDPSIRAQLNADLQDKGLAYLQGLLKDKDPAYYEIVDSNNHQRVIRALEVILATGNTFSSFRGRKPQVKRPFKIIKVAINDNRAILFERINHRMDLMIEAGLFKEAQQLYKLRYLNALQTVGYTEIFNHMDGMYNYDEAVRLLKRNSRRYAKRQLTWLKRDPDYTWFDHSKENVLDAVKNLMISL